MPQVSYQLLLCKFGSFVKKAKFFTVTNNLLLFYFFNRIPRLRLLGMRNINTQAAFR